MIKFKCILLVWVIAMLITGYHGTSLNNAHNILNEGKFKISNTDTEWLGSGIYFYYDINDAYGWRNTEAILHSVIKIENDEFLDIDSTQGGELFYRMVEYMANLENKSINVPVNVQKNQCALMKMLWDTYPKIKVMAASFPKEPTKFKVLLDRRPLRKEFCVRNNPYIKYTQLIRKGDLDD